MTDEGQICGNRTFPQLGGVTPPYIAISPQSSLPHPYPINVRARRALPISYFLFLIYYLNCPSPAKPHPPHNSPGTLPRPKNAPPGRFCPAVRETRGAGCSRPRWCTDSQHPGKSQQKKQPYVFRKAVPWCTMWEQTRTLLFIRAASASHDCSPGSDAVVPPREDKRGVLKYQGAFAAYPRFTNWAAVFHSPLDISPSLFFRLIAEQPTIPYSKQDDKSIVVSFNGTHLVFLMVVAS